MKISVVIPTHNRQQKIIQTVGKLRAQNFPAEDYEVIVVDDGSTPPVVLPADFQTSPAVLLLRLGGVERSAARNSGAAKARGELLVFIDDDITVGENFLKEYWDAHLKYPDALFVGAMTLPEDFFFTPFGRFRQNLEKQGLPNGRVEIEQKNFCSAGNMAIASEKFRKISGFDLNLSSAEDQDFALRHTADGSRIFFVPGAAGIHQDNALDIRGYCRRNEWGSRLILPFCQRYPDLPANVERQRINGEIQWGSESISLSCSKLFKSMLASTAGVESLFFFTNLLERAAPHSPLLKKSYEILLGTHIFRGYRTGLRETKTQKK